MVYKLSQDAFWPMLCRPHKQCWGDQEMGTAILVQEIQSGDWPYQYGMLCHLEGSTFCV